MKQSPKARSSSVGKSASLRPASITLPTSPLVGLEIDQNEGRSDRTFSHNESPDELNNPIPGLIPLQFEEADISNILNVIEEHRLELCLRGASDYGGNHMSVLSVIEYMHEQVDRKDSLEQEVRLYQRRLKETESIVAMLERKCLSDDELSIGNTADNENRDLPRTENEYSKQYVVNLEYKYLKLQGKFDSAQANINALEASLQKSEEEIQRVDRENEVPHGLKESGEERIDSLEGEMRKLQGRAQSVVSVPLQSNINGLDLDNKKCGWMSCGCDSDSGCICNDGDAIIHHSGLKGLHYSYGAVIVVLIGTLCVLYNKCAFV